MLASRLIILNNQITWFTKTESAAGQEVAGNRDPSPHEANAAQKLVLLPFKAGLLLSLDNSME